MKKPANTALCILVLAVSIAMTTSMFKVCQAILFTNAPYDRSERIVQVCRSTTSNNYNYAWPFDSYKEFINNQNVFSETLAYFGHTASVQNNNRDQRISACFVTYDFSEFTAIKTIRGRSFQEKDAKPNSERVIIINENLWASIYNMDPNIIGKTMVLDGIIRTIIGVMPKRFDGPAPLSGIQIWIPLNPDTLHRETGWANYVSVIAKIRDDITYALALESTISLSKQIYNAYPTQNRNMVSAQFRFINDDLIEDNTKQMYLALFACAFLILLMACGIASGLMTARYSTRVQEFAIRRALGASRLQLVIQMGMEFLIISISATVFGFLLEHWISQSYVMSYLEQLGLPAYILNQTSDPHYIFTISMLLIATIASTMLPAIRASKTDITSVIHESTRTGSSLKITRLSNILIIWQVASAGTILSAGALMGHVIYKFSQMNNFYDADEYVCASVSLNPNDHADDEIKKDRINRIMNELEGHPELECFGITTEFFARNYINYVWIEGEAYPDRTSVPVAAMRVISPGYFKMTNVPLISGREFNKSDNINNMNVAIVTDTFAKRFYDSTNVIGKRLKNNEDAPFLTIVGVVPDIFMSDGTPRHPEGFFVPYSVSQWQNFFIMAKSHDSIDHTAEVITNAVHEVDNKICVSDIMLVSDYRNRFGGGLFMDFLFELFFAFAAGALLMSAAGLYGIISFSINSKRKDMGIRLALGASPQNIVLIIARMGLINTGTGIVLSVFGTLIIRRLILVEFPRIMSSSSFWSAYVISATILLCVTSTAILIPALRGALTDPSSALRDE